MDGQTLVGVVRFDVEGKEARISISVDRNGRKRGYARQALKLGMEKMQDMGIQKFTADVMPSNLVSIKLFGNAGFRLKNIVLGIARYFFGA